MSFLLLMSFSFTKKLFVWETTEKMHKNALTLNFKGVSIIPTVESDEW